MGLRAEGAVSPPASAAPAAPSSLSPEEAVAAAWLVLADDAGVALPSSAPPAPRSQRHEGAEASPAPRPTRPTSPRASAPESEERPDRSAASGASEVEDDRESLGSAGDEQGADAEAPPPPRPLLEEPPPREVPGRMARVVGARLRSAGAVLEFDAGEQSYQRDELVFVESDQGPRVARVAVGTRAAFVQGHLRRVLRRAGAEEQRQRQQQTEREREVFLFCKERLRERKLPMKLIQVELSQSNQKAAFYFASEERIDFRDLVRDLTQKLRLRIEMRQIGVRDEAKMVGGIGACGRELCCTTWLPSFIPVSIKMAKDQGMVLNPAKLAGQCGRLKCCLVYEHDTYKEMGKTLPKVGKLVQTPAGVGKVLEVDVLAQRVRVLLEGGPPETFPGAVVSLLTPPGPSHASSSPSVETPPSLRSPDAPPPSLLPAAEPSSAFTPPSVLADTE